MKRERYGIVTAGWAVIEKDLRAAEAHVKRAIAAVAKQKEPGTRSQGEALKAEEHMLEALVQIRIAIDGWLVHNPDRGSKKK